MIRQFDRSIIYTQKMIKKLLIVGALVVLTACTPSTKQFHPQVLPSELSDCKFYTVNPDGMQNITVVRCPNSSTSTQYKSGKTTLSATVID